MILLDVEIKYNIIFIDILSDLFIFHDDLEMNWTEFNTIIVNYYNYYLIFR